MHWQNKRQMETNFLFKRDSHLVYCIGKKKEMQNMKLDFAISRSCFWCTAVPEFFNNELGWYNKLLIRGLWLLVSLFNWFHPTLPMKSLIWNSENKRALKHNYIIWYQHIIILIPGNTSIESQCYFFSKLYFSVR